MNAKRVLPDRWAALRLFVNPSSYFLVVALVVTIVAKAKVIRSLEGIEAWPLHLLAASLEDIACFLGLAALLAIGERRSAWMQAATVPLALFVCVLALLNAAFVGVTGEQLTWPTISLGMARFGDVRAIAGETLVLTPMMVIAAVLVLALPPIAFHFALHGKSRERAHDARARAHVAGLVAALSLVASLLVPAAPTYALTRLDANALVRAWWSMVRGVGPWTGNPTFAGYKPRELVKAGTTLARHNVIVIVLESVRRDETTLAGGNGRAHTPNLVALAARGIELTATRAAIPHTSKSVWSILCGRLPLMQPTLVELTPAVDVECLPSVLAAAGWRTAFFQSAIGTFEDRPRLVHAVGFREIATAEDIGGQRVSYVGSDDESLDAALAVWIDRAPRTEPFFATLLTSATHHDYELTARAIADARARSLPMTSERERYDRLIEAADRMVGKVVDIVAARGIADRTLIVVVGDHGEGFGEHGAKHHGSNFYDEGLVVPWIMVGPGLAPRRIDADASLVDVTPTLLGLLGGSLAELATPARDVLRSAGERRVVPFGCWYDAACRGFVVDRKKVVKIPETGQAFWFDLTTDPDEHQMQPLTDALAAELAAVERLLDAHRTATWPPTRIPASFPSWTCAENRPCVHH